MVKKEADLSQSRQCRLLSIGRTSLYYAPAPKDGSEALEYGSVAECRTGLAAFFDRYNTRREHQALGYRYPQDVYRGNTIYTEAA